MTGLIWTLDPVSGVAGWQENGGSQPTSEQFNPANTAVADQAQEFLAFGAKATGDTLFDITDPTSLVALTAGLYTAMVRVVATSAMTANGVFVATLLMDADGILNSLSFGGTSAVAGAGDASQPDVTLSGTWYLPVGAKIRVPMYSLDGAQSLDFSLSASVVKIS